MSYPSENVNNSKPLDPPVKQYSGVESRYGPAPPFKRPRNQDSHTSKSAAFIPMNPRRSQSQQHPLVNEVTGNIFYKTRLCAKHNRGNCLNGEKCTFAHGLEELHEPPPNWKEHVHDRRINRAVKFCRNLLLKKKCPFGEKCNFVHQIPNNTEIARLLPLNISAPSITPAGPMLEQRKDTGQTRLIKHLSSSDALLVNKNRKRACLKTKMCPKWESTGGCPFGGNCHYAHGQSGMCLLFALLYYIVIVLTFFFSSSM